MSEFRLGQIVVENGQRQRILRLHPDGSIALTEWCERRTFCERWRDAWRAWRSAWREDQR